MVQEQQVKGGKTGLGNSVCETWIENSMVRRELTIPQGITLHGSPTLTLIYICDLHNVLLPNLKLHIHTGKQF